MKRHFIFFCFMLMLLAACAAELPADSPSPAATAEDSITASTPSEPLSSVTSSTEATMSFALTSDAFTSGQSIPAKYSCVGRNVSPALAWTEPPAATQSFALIMDDPDAPMGTWVHWVLFNIPAERRDLPEELPVTGKNIDPNAIFVGTNSSGNIGYDGPCPPSGMHRYFFKLYALDTSISLLPGATKEQVLREMEGHVLAQAELMGTFSK